MPTPPLAVEPIVVTGLVVGFNFVVVVVVVMFCGGSKVLWFSAV